LPADHLAMFGCMLAIRDASHVIALCQTPSYYPTATTLRVFDTTTFAPVGSLTLPDSFVGATWSDFAYIGGDAVALLAYGMPLQILRAPLIGTP